MEVNVQYKSLTMKIVSAILFIVSSLLITIVNKTVLSVYSFPSYQVLGLGQMLATIAVLGIGTQVQLVQLPPLEISFLRRIWPLPLLYIGNLWTGLGGTKELNFPMFNALRRLSIPMTMVLENKVLGVKASYAVLASVAAMVGGAMLAAADDVTFSWTGYTLVLINDAVSAANGVYLKIILDTRDMNMYGLLFYDSLFMFLPALIFAWVGGDLYISVVCPLWHDSLFLIFFLLSCLLGLLISYCVMLCTKYNSALTTCIIGSVKSIFITYYGILIMDDYEFSWQNYLGLNVNLVACITYACVAFKQKPATGCEQLINIEKEDAL